MFLLQHVVILHFHEQSYSYHQVSKIRMFILDGNLSAVRYAINGATTRVLIGLCALLGADINWSIVRKQQDIMLAYGL